MAAAELKDLSLIYAGDAVFTVRSKATGSRFTFRVRRSDGSEGFAPRFFVSVLTGADNTKDYSYIGWVSEDRRRWEHGKKSRLSESAPSVKAFAWLFSSTEESVKKQAEIFHEGKCCRCGRALTVPESIEAGIGPECTRIMQ